MKEGCLFVDGIDVWTEYGVYVTKGGWNELIGWPSLKSVTANDWQEEDGVEADLSEPVLDTHEVNIEFAVVGEYSSMFNFLNILSDEAYHTFECVEIGRTFKLRLVSSASLKTLKMLGKLKLKFNDDFPMDGYEYEAPESTLPTSNHYLVDEVPLSDYGVRVLQGTYDEISNPSAVKENLLRNISEDAGAEYDPYNVTYKKKDVTLTCLMRAENLEALWRNWYALLHDLVQPGERMLYVDDFEQEFPFYYTSCKVKEFISKDVPWLKFELSITFTRDFRIEDDDVLLATEDFILVFTEEEENAIDMKPIRGSGAVRTYGTPRITSVTYDDIPLSGGTVTPTIRFTQTWTDTDGTSGTYTQDTTDYTVKYTRVGASEGFSVDTETGAVSTENTNEDTSRKAGAAVGITITANGKTSSSTTVNVYQAANERTWETPVVLSLSYIEIYHLGGTVYPTMSFYQRWTDMLGNTGTITEETTDDYTTLYTPSQAIEGVTVNTTTGAVTAKGNTIEERTAVVTILCQVTANGKTSSNTSSSATCTVYQESAAVRTYELPEITRFTYDDIPATGGASMPTIEFTQAWTDTDGNSGTLTQDTTDYSVAYTALGLITGTSINTTTGEISMSMENTTTVTRQIASVQAFVTANGQNSVLHIAYVTQEAGEVTYTYGNPSVTCVYNGYLSNTVGDTISPSLLVTQTREGSDGSVTTLYLQPSEYEVSFNANDSGGLTNATLNTSTGVITCIAANSTASTLQIGMVNTNVTANGKSGSAKTNVYQAAGDLTYEYSDPEVTLSYPTAVNTASTVSPTYSYTQIRTGNDGSSTIISDGGEVSFTMTAHAEGVTIDEDKGVITFGANTYDSARTLANVDITVNLNGKSGAATASVTQIARTYSDVYTWSGLSLTYPDGANTASSVLPSSLTYTLTRVRTYSDGTTETDTWTSGATVTYSMEATGSGISIDSSTGEVSFTANTSDSRKNLGSVTATISLEGQTVTVGNFVYQAARTYTDEFAAPTGSISYTKALATDTQLSPTYSYSQIRTRTYSDGSVATSTLTSGATLNFQTQHALTDVSVDAETGLLTFPVNATITERQLCYVLMDITMNGQTTQVSCEVRQEAFTFTAPVVSIDETIYVEESGSGTKKIYFNVNVTMNDASLVSPDYFESNGVKYYVTQERATNRDSSGTEITTNYWADIQYNGSGAFTSSPLYSAYEIHSGTIDYNGEVESTNTLVNADGTFTVRQ